MTAEQIERAAEAANGAAKAITRGKLTPHQREVLHSIMRLSVRCADAWVPDFLVGSKGACAKLETKGWIESKVELGPHGGEHHFYRPSEKGGD